MKSSHQNEQPESVPFMENLFASDDGKAFLIGSKCTGCSQIYFPAKQMCVECESDAMEPVKFGQRGKLYSFTTSHMSSANFTAPYMAGFIEFAEGPRVFAPLRVHENQVPEIGVDAVLVVDELWRKDSTSVMGYVYELQSQE